MNVCGGEEQALAADAVSICHTLRAFQILTESSTIEAALMRTSDSISDILEHYIPH